MKSVLNRLDPSSSKIIVLCNGALSVRDELSKILDNIPLVLATTTHGAYREEHEKEHFLVHVGVGKTFVEEDPSSADLVQMDFEIMKFSFYYMLLLAMYRLFLSISKTCKQASSILLLHFIFRSSHKCVRLKFTVLLSLHLKIIMKPPTIPATIMRVKPKKEEEVPDFSKTISNSNFRKVPVASMWLLSPRERPRQVKINKAVPVSFTL